MIARDLVIDHDLPPIRRWADVEKLMKEGALSPAEHAVIAAAKAGEMANIGDFVPTSLTEAVLIRAPLMRYLIPGGQDIEQRRPVFSLVGLEHSLD